MKNAFRFIIAVSLVWPAILPAQVPHLVNYQGRVAVGSVNFEGNGQFKFALVNADGSTTYWSNDGTSTAGSQPTAAVPLVVTKGLYAVMLGDTSLPNMTAIPASVWTHPDVRLRVWFNDGTNGSQLLTPDQRLAPNGYLPDGSVTEAKLADGSVSGTKLASGSIGGAQLASGLTLGGITTGTFSGNLTGNSTSATIAGSATNFTGALVGDVTGTQGATTIAATTITGKALTGFSSTTGTITAGDSLLTAINKLDGNLALKAPLASPTFTGTVSGTFSGNGAALTSLNASNLGSGTVADARLSANVAMRNAANTFAATQTMAAGTTTLAPLKLQTGVNLTTPQFGAVEFDGTNLFLTNNSGTPTRKTLAFTDSTISAGQITNGTITGAMLANGAVGSAQLAAGAVTSVAIAPGTVVPMQLISGTNQPAAANTSYLATNASLTTIDLANTTANVGDQVQVTGSGAGGWMATYFHPSQWTARENNRSWVSVASSADGSKLVAVVNNGQIYTSTDFGVSWTARESNRGWYSVASSADGSKLVAVVGSGGQIYTSTDSGVSWTARESARSWRSVASSADGSKLVAVVSGGQIYTSSDAGVNWTARESNRGWHSVASSADGSKLVAVAYTGQIYTSTDSGVSWTARESNRLWTAVASSADGSTLVAVVQNGQIYTSSDSGVSWTPRENNRSWYSVASSADGTKLVAVATGGQIYNSTDAGISWSPQESDRAWVAVACSSDGTKAVAMVLDGRIHTKGGTVTAASGAQGTAATLQYLGDGEWTALGLSNGSVGSSQLAAGAVGNTQIATGAVGSSNLASNLTLGGTTTGTFSGNLTGNASTATTADSATNFTGLLAGDITGTQGATTIAPGAVNSAKIADGSIVNADISGSAAIAYGKLSLGGSIVNADIASGAAIVDTKLATLSTGGKVANSATTATTANTAGSIVSRDASGNFSAGTITAALNGNANSATTALTANSATTANTATTAGSATSFTGALAGDVTGTQGATTIAATTITGKVLTGFSSTTGAITASDSLLTAINKLDGNLALKAPLASPSFTGTVSGTFSGNGSALTSLNASNLGSGTVADARLSTNVAMRNAANTFTATQTMAAGTTTLAPLKLQTGVNLTTPQFGAVEFDGTNLFLTNNSGTPTRKTLAFTDSTISAGQIANGTITGAMLANGAVGSAQLAAGAVTSVAIAPGTVVPQQTVSGQTVAAVNTSYAATGSATPDTFTLPATANVGDVIQITGSGSGGWNTTGAWVARESNRNWTSVASSADGSKLVAVAYGGPIHTSTDFGVNWTARDSSRGWYSVASSADGRKLVAVVNNGQIYTSTNFGVSWTARESNRAWQYVASSDDGSKLVAVVDGGQIYTSTDSGMSWTARESSRNWRSVASSADGSKLVAAVYGGQIYTSTDSGVSWMARESNRWWRSVASSTDGSKLVAVVDPGQIHTSADSGVSWTARESNRIWFSVASSADGSKLVAGVFGGRIYTNLSGTQGEAVTLQYVGNDQWTARQETQIATGAVGNLQIATGAVGNTQLSSGLDVSKLGGGTVDNTELSYLDGVTSNIQGQFGTLTTNLGNLTTTVNGKVSKAGDTMTGALAIQPTTTDATATARLNLIANGAHEWRLQSVTGFSPPPGSPTASFQLINTTSAVTALTVLQDGKVGIGRSDPGFLLDVNGGIRCVGAVNTTSDLRFKTNIEPLSGALDQVQRLQGVGYDWRREEHPSMKFSDRHQFGFIAQEVREVIPEVVSEDGDGYLSIGYSALIPVLTEALKELRAEKDAEIERLDEKLAEAEAGNEALMRRLDALEARLSGMENAAPVLPATDAPKP